MQQQDMEQRYSQALALCQRGQYAEALQVFEALETALPNSKEVLYGRAMCLVALGRGEQARPLCERLTTVFMDPRGQQLLMQIDGGAAPKKARKARGGLWRTVLAVAVAIPLAVGTLMVATDDGGGDEERPKNVTPPPPEPVQTFPTNLRILGLGGNPVRDSALEDVAVLDGLERLDLKGTGITNNAVEHLRSIRTLRELDATDTMFTESGAGELKKTVPNVEVKL